jgi:hypothetical protein
MIFIMVKGNAIESLANEPLEVPCKSCAGKAGYRELGRWIRCGSCGGRGYEPTAAGKRILALVLHNMRGLNDSFENDAS